MGRKDSIENAFKDVKDTVAEIGHRGAAEGERVKRETLGDEMTTGEKVKSVANEVKEKVQAEYDATKRDVREKH
ncbi:MAG TPA: hypothetical protein VGF86_09045 [Candidatus Tumulicola sp.]